MADDPQVDPTPQPPASDDPPKGEHNQDGYWKRQAEKHSKELEKLRKAQMSDLERAQAERDEAKRERDEAASKLKQTQVRGRFETAAAKAGCIDAEAAFSLSDITAMGDAGETVDKAVDALKKAKPYLFGAKSSLGGAGAGNGEPPRSGNQEMNDRIRKFWRGGV